MAKTNYQNIDEYIATFSKEIQEILERLRQAIHQAVPEAKEAISYQMPTFKLNGNIIHFAAFKEHIGVYPAPSGIEEFKEDLAKYKTSTGTLQFQLDEHIPYELVGRIAKFRADENKSKPKKAY